MWPHVIKEETLRNLLALTEGQHGGVPVSGQESHHGVPLPFPLDHPVSSCKQGAGRPYPFSSYPGNRELCLIPPRCGFCWETLTGSETAFASL